MATPSARPRGTPFPISIDQLTTDLLSHALDTNIASFTASRIGADRGMLGEIHLLELDHDGAAPDRIVAKFAALREGTLASALRGRNYERELLCYEQLLADTPVRAPACHGTWYDPDTAHFLLLQEAIESDDADQVAGLTLSQARTVITQMAALHARWWGDAELVTHDWLPPLDSPMRINNLTTLARTGWPQLVAMLGPSMPTVPADFGERFPDRLEAALRTIASLPHTLLHCDLRADNLLFDPNDGAVTLVDWQGCGIGPAAFDLAYFLVQSLTVDMRRSHEDELITLWAAELTARGVDSPDPTAGFASSLWYGLAIACALPVIADPDETRVLSLTHAVAERSIAALRDHGELSQ